MSSSNHTPNSNATPYVTECAYVIVHTVQVSTNVVPLEIVSKDKLFSCGGTIIFQQKSEHVCKDLTILHNLIHEGQ